MSPAASEVGFFAGGEFGPVGLRSVTMNCGNMLDLWLQALYYNIYLYYTARQAVLYYIMLYYIILYSIIYGINHIG